MSKSLHAAFVVMVLALSGGANAQATGKDISESGNRYLELCSDMDKPAAQWNEMDLLNFGTCQGFILGVRDGISLSLSMFKESGNAPASLKATVEDFGICIPDRVNLGQLNRVVLKYIRDNPEKSHLPSAQLVVEAEHKAFPCVKSKQ